MSANIVKGGTSLFTVLIFFLSTPLATAHNPGEEVEAAGGFAIELTSTQVIQNDKVPLEAHITKEGEPVTNLEVIFTVDKHDIGLSESLETREREPGHYFVFYKFVNSGQHEIHVEFAYEGEKIRKTADVDVAGMVPEVELYFLVAAAAILALIWFFGLKGKKKKMKRNLILSLIVVAALGLVYSLYAAFTTGAVQKGVIVCPTEDNCIWQAHVHAYVPTIICGDDVRLPIEKGPLDGPHTHEEKNVIHWHDRLPYDKANQRILDATPLTLGAFFDAIDIIFDSDRIMGKENGGVCPDGGIGTLKMFVDGKQNNQFRNYVWEDRDVILLVFDSRAVNEIEAQLATQPIKFPTLGRG